MTLSESILATLAYHDIFDYPLKVDEVHKYLIAAKSSLSSVQEVLRELKVLGIIGERHGYFFLKNRPNLVAARLQRAKYSHAKLKRAKLYSKLLTLIPTVQLIAISGALAMENSHKKDDIDLVLISKKNTLWTTRFLANILLFPFKRKPQTDSTTDNKACLNLFLDEGDLTINPQNLYFAHEIAQMKPLWDKETTYSRFIKANIWIHKYLPNWQPESSQLSVHSSRKVKPSTVNRFSPENETQPSAVENFLRNFQLWYMRKKVSTEKIGEHQLFFHPSDTPEWVLKQYRKSIKRLKIASNNNFSLTSKIPL
ncbi:MAG: hypothetical protein AAB639_03660 [Patescibacteria group bacterium]